MKTYDILVRETRVTKVTVEASNPEEAGRRAVEATLRAFTTAAPPWIHAEASVRLTKEGSFREAVVIESRMGRRS